MLHSWKMANQPLQARLLKVKSVSLFLPVRPFDLKYKLTEGVQSSGLKEDTQCCTHVVDKI